MAGYTTVTLGPILDASGNVYVTSKVSASLNLGTPASGTGPALLGGTSVFQTMVLGETDSFGQLVMTLADNALITPANTTWNFSVLNTTGLIGFSLNNVTITGATQNIAAAMQAASAPLVQGNTFPSITVTGTATIGGALAANGGVTTTAAALAVNKPVNATTGYQIGGAAPANQVLGGNGTNFVSRVITPADATGNTSGSGNFALTTSPVLTTPNIGAATATSVTSTTVVGNGTGSQANAGIQSIGASASVSLDASGQAVDNKWWEWIATGTTLLGRIINDANNNAIAWITANRTGMAIGAITFGAGGGVQTLPTATDTLVGRATTDTLTAKRITPRVVTMADAASVTPTSDTADINIFSSSQVAGTLTVNAPSGTPTDGQKLILRLKSTNAQTYSFNATYAFSTSVTAPTTLAAGKTDYIGLLWDATNIKWDVASVDQGH